MFASVETRCRILVSLASTLILVAFVAFIVLNSIELPTVLRARVLPHGVDGGGRELNVPIKGSKIR